VKTTTDDQLLQTDCPNNLSLRVVINDCYGCLLYLFVAVSKGQSFRLSWFGWCSGWFYSIAMAKSIEFLCWSPTCPNYRGIRTTKKVTPFPPLRGHKLSRNSLGCALPPQHGGFTGYGKLS